MTTARDLIEIALYDAGIFGMGQSPNAIDINRGLTRLNDMINQWKRNRWLVYHLVDTDKVMTGATSYTVGTGGYFDIDRPDRLEAARIIQNNPPSPNDVGWPLQLIQSRENYNNIRLQHLGSFPYYIFYDAAFPLGSVFPWPLPSSQYTLRLTTKAVLQTFADLSTVYEMPEEYKRAIRFNLQVEMMSAYKLPVDDNVAKMATGALSTIRNANTQIPTLLMPQELVRDGLYNVFSDNTV